MPPSPRKKAPTEPALQAPAADPGLRWIERMRVYRGRPERDLSVGAQIGGLEREFSQRQRSLGDVIEAWNELTPPRVRGLASISGLSAGTLTLAAQSSSAGYELTRELRGGLEKALVAKLPGRVRRIKVKVGGE